MNLNALDASAFVLINQTLSVPALDPVMVFITNYNVLLFLGVYLMIYRAERLPSLVPFGVALVSFGLGDWTAHLIKDQIQRVRPENVLQGVRLLVHRTHSFSMPSNHAANSFAFVAPFYVFSRSRWRHGLLAVAVAVAYSRPYVGVHYPGDVLAGAVYGTVLGGSVAIITRRVLRGRLPVAARPVDLK